MSNVVNLGIIGCGDIVKKKFLNAIKGVDSVKLVAVCDIMEERAKEICELGKAQAFYTDYNEMLESPDIHAVIITTPHPFHADPVISAAKAGKHILVEKPMAVKQVEIDAMLQAVNDAGMKLVVLPFVYSPAFLKCKDLIAKGLLGEIIDVEGISISGVLPPSPWYLSSKAGVGAIADNGVYSLSTVIALLGPVKEIFAVTARSTATGTLTDGQVCNLEQEDNARIILKYENGKIGSITCGWSHGDGKSMVTVYGRAGVAIIDGWENGTLLFRPKNPNLCLPEINNAPEIEFLGKKYFVLENKGTSGTPAVKYLANAIIENRDLSSDLKMNRHVMEIILKAYESANKKQPVEIISRF